LSKVIADARSAVSQAVKFPPGYYVTWSGQFEYLERATEKMKIVVPVTLLLIFLATANRQSQLKKRKENPALGDFEPIP